MKRHLDQMDHYYNALRDRTPMTPDELQEAVKLARNGDTDAFNRIIESNLRFVVSTAARYPGKQLPLEDLIAEGNLGLIEAAKRFNPDLGYRFTTYAVYWIRRAIQNGVLRCGHAYRQPSNRIEDLVRVRKTQREMMGEIGREPSTAEVADALGYSVGRVEAAISSASPDLMYDGDEEDRWYPADHIADTTDTPDVAHITNSRLDNLQEALASLDERERAIIIEHFGLGREDAKSLSQIGRQLGLSRERVRQLKDRAIMRLRRTLGNGTSGLDVFEGLERSVA